MAKREYPTPCLRENPTGSGVVFETPSGVQTPFDDMDAGVAYVISKGVARRYGRVFQQVEGTKRFIQLDEDDGADID